MIHEDKISGNMQYLADTMLIEKLCLIDSTIGLHKQAGLADGMLGSIAGSIMSWAKEHIDTDHGVTGVLSSLADIMIPGILFKINPLLGGLGTAAEALGFSPVSIIKKIMQFLHQKLSSGSLPTMDEINSVGKSAVAAVAGPLGSQASDMFDILHEIEKRGQLVRLVRTAQSPELLSLLGAGKQQKTPEIPFFGGKGGIIERIFGQLFKTKATGKARWLLGGFVVWIIKTILLGAGLIAGGEKIMSLLGGKKQQQEQVQPHEATPQDETIWAGYRRPIGEEEKSPTPAVQAPATVSRLTPTGRGQDTHTNDHKTSTWVVPMVGGSLENTLLAWAEDVYKELAGKSSMIAATESFNKTVEEMRRGLDSSRSNQITVPPQFKSRKQVVDRFAKDV